MTTTQASQLATGDVVVWRDNAGNEETSVITALQNHESWLAVRFDNSWSRSFKADAAVELASP